VTQTFKNGCQGDACMGTENPAIVLRGVISGEQLLLQ